MVAATNLSTLSLSSLKPWHLKLEVTVFDEHGEDPSPGTIEVWHDGHNQRTVFTFGTSTRTLINNDTGFYAAHTGPQIPALSESVLAEVLHPGPYLDSVNNATPEQSEQKFGKVELECIMLSQPIRHVGVIPFGLYPTYCFDHDNDNLRASFNAGSYTVLRNEISPFQGQDVSYNLVILKGHNTHVADAKIVTIETFTPSDSQFVPDDSMKKGEAITRVSGGLMAGHILTKASPIYPASRSRRTSVAPSRSARSSAVTAAFASFVPSPPLTPTSHSQRSTPFANGPISRSCSTASPQKSTRPSPSTSTSDDSQPHHGP